MYVSTCHRVYCEYNNLHDIAKERNSGLNGISGGETTSSGEQFGPVEQETPFETPEEQILHFLSRAGRPRWKWMSVRPRSPQPHHNSAGGGSGGNSGNNGGSSHGQHMSGQSAHQQQQQQAASKKSEPYFCDRNLLQTLVRDALVTDGMDRPAHPTRKEDKQ